MKFSGVIIFLVACYHQTNAFQPPLKNEGEFFAANLLRAIVDRINKDYVSDYATSDDRPELRVRTRVSPTRKEDDDSAYSQVSEEDIDGIINGGNIGEIGESDSDANQNGNEDNEDGGGNDTNRRRNNNMVPSLRDSEYLQHSSSWGHQFVTGGAGEGKQNLKPEGSIPNKNEVKTDAVLPAYCNPPNPCPIGFTTDDGCIQRFENTAAFSREYQVAQKCMCDTEHMFDCPSTRSEFSYGNDLDFEQIVRRYKVQRGKDADVKKMYPDKVTNPFLHGEMLPIAAKKGINIGYL